MRRPASSSAQIISRMARMRLSSKNMCSVRQSPMPSAPNSRAWLASRGVSALARTPSVRALSAQPMMVAKSPDSSGWRIFTRPLSTSPLPPSTVMMSPFLNTWPPTVMVPALVVDAQRTGAAHARPPHAARHHGGVARHAAAGGENAGGRVHAVDVLGARLDANQDDLAALALQGLGLVGIEYDLARRGARATPAAPWPRRSSLHPGRWWDAGADRARRHRRAAPPRPR